ncbi:hypothetical protein [Collimonas fungivorans]|uniref:hypothetical protein n=1 Tax=Collimonas fungivorans TaxID=158899 RepID=UPI0002D4F39A
MFILLFAAIAILNAHAQTQIIYENYFCNADIPTYQQSWDGGLAHPQKMFE